MDPLQAWGLNLGPHVGQTGALLLAMLSFYFLSFKTGSPSVYSVTGLELVSPGVSRVAGIPGLSHQAWLLLSIILKHATVVCFLRFCHFNCCVILLAVAVLPPARMFPLVLDISVVSRILLFK